MGEFNNLFTRQNIKQNSKTGIIQEKVVGHAKTPSLVERISRKSHIS